MAQLGILPTGTIYTMYYSRWKHNIKIYAFILYAGLASPKVHALNLGARELSSMDRAKLFAIIRRLGMVPAAHFLKGPYLYRLLRTFAKPEMSKCYRTYFRANITKASLLNYGICKEGDIPVSAFITMKFDRNLYSAAQRDMVVKMINSNQRAYNMNVAKSSFAKPGAISSTDLSAARKKASTPVPDTTTTNPKQTVGGGTSIKKPKIPGVK